VNRRIDEEDGGPRDVEKLGADRILDLALLALVDQRADQTGRDQGQQRKGQRELGAEALPGRSAGAVSFSDAPMFRPGSTVITSRLLQARARAVDRATTGPLHA